MAIEMDRIQLLVDLHKGAARQGSGGEAETRVSIALSGLSTAETLSIADIGCGTGASTLVLAQHLDAHITAVDFIPEFLAKLEADAARAGIADRITTLCASMEALPFEEAASLWISAPPSSALSDKELGHSGEVASGKRQVEAACRAIQASKAPLAPACLAERRELTSNLLWHLSH